MNERVTRFALGANIGLSRHECATCGSETLHKHDACIHCGTHRHIHSRKDTRTPQERLREGMVIRRKRA